MKTLLEVFLTFLKIGGFTFGGGYAMIPLIQRETVENKKWITDEDILDIVAIAESTPGPIAINAATFVGYKVAGMAGAVSATLGVVLPSLVIISLISYVLGEFQELRAVRYAFFGVRACVLALILRAFWKMAAKQKNKKFAYALAAAAFALVVLMKVNVLLVILLCAAAGLVSTLAAERRLK